MTRMKAIGVGIHDGYFLPGNIRYPYPIGIEAAGIIEKKGRNVTSFQEGDQIAFVSAMQGKGGTWAEYAVVADNSLIIPIPQGMSFAEAADVPVAGNTALKAFHCLQLKPNDSLFIAGASGAIGTLAIQIAVAKGYVVAGTASKKNHDHTVKDELTQLMNKIVLDEVKLVIEQTYRFEKGLEALHKTGTRRARGKIVITMS